MEETRVLWLVYKAREVANDLRSTGLQYGVVTCREDGKREIEKLGVHDYLSRG